MAYIGKEPVVGNFQVCDSISVVNGQAAYTLQVSSTNVVPESSQHCLVSLNGILQAPVTSFTVSGSTLTFASNLATNDVIDFVILLGNVLDLGVPSDGTITNAKLSGDLISGETDIGGAIADAGGTLRKTAMSRVKTYVGAVNTPAFEAHMSANQELSDNTATKLSFNSENIDSDTTYDNSTNYRFTPAVAGKYYVFAMAVFDAQATNVHRSANLYLYKNGQIHKTGYFDNYDNDTWYAITPYVATMVELDTDDYMEVYAKFDTDGSSSRRMTAGQYTTFGAYKIIGA